MYWTKPCSSSSGFGHLCRSLTARDAWPRPRGSGSRAMTSTPCAASERATARPVMWQLKTKAFGKWGAWGGSAPPTLDTRERVVDVRDQVLRVVGKTRIAHACDLRMLHKMARDRERALALTPHAQRERSQASDREPGFVRRQVRAVEDRAIAHGTAQLFRSSHDTAHYVAVPIHVFGERVDDHRGAERSRPEEDRRRECRVHRERGTFGASELRQRGDVGDPKKRIGDRLDIQEPGRFCGERPLDRRVIGGVDERNVCAT